jgi:hypothetical protein
MSFISAGVDKLAADAAIEQAARERDMRERNYRDQCYREAYNRAKDFLAAGVSDLGWTITLSAGETWASTRLVVAEGEALRFTATIIRGITAPSYSNRDDWGGRPYTELEFKDADSKILTHGELYSTAARQRMSEELGVWLIRRGYAHDGEGSLKCLNH